MTLQGSGGSVFGTGWHQVLEKATKERTSTNNSPNAGAQNRAPDSDENRSWPVQTGLGGHVWIGDEADDSATRAS